jgi:hypothetical protein
MRTEEGGKCSVLWSCAVAMEVDLWFEQEHVVFV